MSSISTALTSAKLLNGEYAFMEVPPGTVVVSGLPKMYYGSLISPPALR